MKSKLRRPTYDEMISILELRSLCFSHSDIAGMLGLPAAMVKRVCLGDGWSEWYRDERGGVIVKKPDGHVRGEWKWPFVYSVKGRRQVGGVC